MESIKQSSFYPKCRFYQFAFRRTLFAHFMIMSQLIVLAQKYMSIVEGTIIAEAGTKVSGILQIPECVDQDLFIPFTLTNGMKPGPVLTIIAGNHVA